MGSKLGTSPSSIHVAPYMLAELTDGPTADKLRSGSRDSSSFVTRAPTSAAARRLGAAASAALLVQLSRPVMLAAAHHLHQLGSAFLGLPSSSRNASSLLLIIVCSCLAGLILLFWRVLRGPPPCYLVDFSCTQGNESYAASGDNFGRFLRSWRSVTERNMRFQFKVFVKAGVGEETRAPAQLFERGELVDMQDARVESEDLISDAARRVLRQTAVDPKEIDIIIVNSSLFNPVPSLTAYLVNALGLRSNVRSFNLAGMGCSAGLIAIDLAAHLLKVHRNAYALVVSTENISKNMYFGNDRSMMVSNCLFRCGCSAVLLTNKRRTLRLRPKMQLLHCLRTNLAADDKAFDCVQHMEDAEGKLGVSLKISLLEVADAALRANITRLAPHILPWGELVRVAASMARKWVMGKAAAGPVYQPDFKKAIDHFCIHPGGRAVLDSIGKGLRLSEYDVEPGRMALERFGNTSSSGIWFALAYCEGKGRLTKGSRVWQIALGSGFKCNSGVWRVLRDIDPRENTHGNPWLPCIERFPTSAAFAEVRVRKFAEIFSQIFGGGNALSPEHQHQHQHQPPRYASGQIS